MHLRSVWSKSMMVALVLAGFGCDGASATPDAGTLPGDGGNDARVIDVDGGRTDGGRRDDAAMDDAAMDDAAMDDAAMDDAAMDDAAMDDAGSDAGTIPVDFSVTSFDTTNCGVLDVDGVIGDDRGGIAVSTDRVLLDGDNATATWTLDLDDAQIAGAGGLTTISDDIVADVATGQAYLLADVDGPLGYDGGEAVTDITRIIAVDDDGVLGAEVTLATPIHVDASDWGATGIFAGSGEIGVYDGTSLFVITLATGAVESTTLAITEYAECESWAFWGLLERAAGVRSIVYVANGTTIVRTDVSTGTTTTVGTFTDLNDMCSIAASPSSSRWYFHHEGGSQFTTTALPGASEVVGFCSGTFTVAGGDFTVGSLDATGCSVIEADGLIGDDHGGIAVTSSHVFVMGDDGIGRWDLALANPSGAAPPIRDGVFTDYSTGTVWSLATATELFARDLFLASNEITITRIVALDSFGNPTATEVTLSAPLVVDDDNTYGVFSGWGELALVVDTNSPSLLVDITTGAVTSLGEIVLADHETCENWAYWGILEHVGDTRSLVAVRYNEIFRQDVTATTATTISTFTDTSDMCSIALSTSLDRWYFHHEGGSQFTSGLPITDEILGYCDATIVHP